MAKQGAKLPASAAAEVLLAAGSASDAIPVYLIAEGDDVAKSASLTPEQARWVSAIGFKPAARRHVLLPDADGRIAGVVMGMGTANGAAAATVAGSLPTLLPVGAYRLVREGFDHRLAATAWALGAYRFQRYKGSAPDALPRLVVEKSVDRAEVLDIADGVALGRDMINTPACDMTPADIELATRTLAGRHRAQVQSIVGDDLLAQNFPMIHAVGRASATPPRLVELVWGSDDHPKVTLVGKGISFDTGGLDIKPSSNMLLMKKDMGGAATVLALGHMIMARKLPVRLRILIPTAENAISGNAFRPSDVLKSRSGRTVEVGNTDAEGRLVLADALALADEESPDTLLCFATLTGAARVALGPELPPFFTNDEALAAALAAHGEAVADPMWRLPLKTPYESWLDSPVADMGNVAEGGFAGAIVAAMFLNRFVSRARRFAHFDIYGWRAAQKPLGPKGGETQGARAVYELLKAECRR